MGCVLGDGVCGQSTLGSDLVNFLRRYPQLVGYLIMAVGFIGVVALLQLQSDASKKQTCIAVVEDRVVVRNIVDFALGVSTSPQATEFRNYVYKQLEIPPNICSGTGVDVTSIVRYRTRGSQ